MHWTNLGEKSFKGGIRRKRMEYLMDKNHLSKALK